MNWKIKILIIVFCVFTIFFTISLDKFVIAAENQKQVEINNIIVKNNQRIDTETILSYLKIKPGDRVNYRILNKKLKLLYELGLFADIKFRVTDNNLIVYIKENPLINNIIFVGNKKIKEDALVSEVSLKSRNVFNKKEVQDSLEVIRNLYKRSGYFSSKIKADISKLTQNRVDITFKINEGGKTRIKGIKFIGNKIFSDKRLKGIVSTKESKLWRILSSGDIYDPDRINYDKDLLRRYYLQEGYADFKIISAVAELTKDKSGFFITYSLNEGDKYKFGNVKLVNKNISEFNNKKITSVLKSIENKPYNIDKLDFVIKEIKDFGGNLGYAFLNVSPSFKKDKKEKRINITININEAKKIYVRRINVKGNNRTEDKVVRREMRFNEGDGFNNEKLRRSEQRIRNLDFFETVESETKPTDKSDRTDINIVLTEKATGQFSIGGGFSSSNGALANVGIEERNFMGKGQDLRARFTLSERASELDFGFTEPYLYGKDMALGVDLFKIKTTFADESSFDNDKVGAGVRLGYMITERTRHSWNYTAKREEIEGVKSGASDFITNQKGSYTTSAFAHNLSFFGINDRLDPTNGMKLNISNKLAGFGGNVYFFQSDLKHSWFYSITDDYIFSTHLKGGYIFGYNDDKVSLKDRYFLGADSFPGFETAGIGPRDTTSTNKDALGGNLMYTARTELKIPIPGISPKLGIRGALFGVAGTVTEVDEDGGDKIKDDSSPRISAGFGVEWKSPFGPIRLDFAHAVMKEDYDRTQFFKFNFGTQF